MVLATREAGVGCERTRSEMFLLHGYLIILTNMYDFSKNIAITIIIVNSFVGSKDGKRTSYEKILFIVFRNRLRV